MADAEWIENLRQIVMKAVESGEPCNIILGTVVSSAPLSIQIDQKTTLTRPQLLLTSAVKEHTREMSIPGVGTVTATVKAGLKPGESVMLLQKRGGQQYVVLDRQ